MLQFSSASSSSSFFFPPLRLPFLLFAAFHYDFTSFSSYPPAWWREEDGEKKICRSHNFPLYILFTFLTLEYERRVDTYQPIFFFLFLSFPHFTFSSLLCSSSSQKNKMIDLITFSTTSSNTNPLNVFFFYITLIFPLQSSLLPNKISEEKRDDRFEMQTHM